MSLRVLLALTWTAVLLTLCLIPGRWLRRVESERPPMIIPHLDKVVHGGMFAVFSVLWMWAGRAPKRVSVVVVAGLLLAAVTELGQGLPAVARDPDIFDAVADVVGVVVGVAGYRVLESLFTKSEAVSAEV